MKPMTQTKQRRHFLAAMAGLFAGVSWGQDERVYDQPRAGRVLTLPLDHAGHPDYRTEWWYFTGWLTREGKVSKDKPTADNPTTSHADNALGLQITFFRSAPKVSTHNKSRFSPTQLLFAHVAVADPARGQLWHDQISVRHGLADSEMVYTADAERTFKLRLRDWRLTLLKNGQWEASIRGRQAGAPYALDLSFSPTQTPWLQGNKGFSQKGPRPEQSSHYITLPHLQTRGRIQLEGQTHVINSGTTWMDHEWSTTVLDPAAQGWDWVGLHGLDGSSIMAFAIRPDVWRHAAIRQADGRVKELSNVALTPVEQWTSGRTQTRYPVSMRLQLDNRTFELRPLMNDQELDARASTGTIYWEGAVSVYEMPAGEAGQGKGTLWGRGYLELTGYHKPMRL